MKSVLVVISILTLGGIALAQPSDPCLDYLKNPTPQGYRRARAYLDSALLKNSQDHKALIYSVYIDQANLAQQIDRLYEIRDSLDNRNLFGLANVMLEMGDFQRAIDIYERLNTRMPQWSCPWRHKGQALYRLGKLREAEESLLRSVEARATHYDAWVWLARVQKDLGKRKEALVSITKAFENKYRDVETPEQEMAAGEDVKLLEEILILNRVKKDRLAAERERIIGLGSRNKRKEE